MTPCPDQARRKAQTGLTLFELLVVLAIIALLAALVAPRVVGYLGRAKSDAARSQLANIATSLELFYYDVGRYPTPAEGLRSLVDQPASAAGWAGPYFKDPAGLTDPWGRDYLYAVDMGRDVFTVSSLGRDGETGGDGEDADIAKS